jgi:peptidoglycan hydrolase-like protein with peptidoglycan-binding domain
LAAHRLGVATAVVTLAAVLARTAVAAPPAVAIAATPTSGSAPLTVTLQATGDPATYAWSLGDGTSAVGPTVTHRYDRPGAYRVVVHATASNGEAADAEATVTALRVTLARPHRVRFRSRVTIRGRIEPVLPGTRVNLQRDSRTIGHVSARRNGSFRITIRGTAPGTLTAVAAGARSAAVPLLVRAVLVTRVTGQAVIGGRAAVSATVRPAAAGPVRLRVARDGAVLRERRGTGRVRARLPTSRPATFWAHATVDTRPGWVVLPRTLRAHVVAPTLSLGARGGSVQLLERRLADLRYALARVDGVYEYDTVQALLAFQQLHGLPATGRADARTWRTLGRTGPPVPRYGGPGAHIEVSKGGQYLLLVRNGRVEVATHVSTGATGNTPLGRFRVYRKVTGWDWVLWYPLYFLRGFAVHGYPDVPAYPASHGCVRVPMWIATRIWSAVPYGGFVYIYW